MTRETKIGLLVGLAFIIVIGILLSDYNRNESPAAALNAVAGDVQKGAATPHNGSTESAILPPPATPAHHVPTRDELHQPAPTPPRPPVALGNPGNPVPPVAPTPPHPVTPLPPVPGPIASNPPHPTDDGLSPELRGLIHDHPHELTPADPPAPGNPPRTDPPTVNGAVAYVAVSGDTVSRLAGRFLGGNTTANRNAILAINPTLKQDPNKITVGKTYMIPPKPGVAAPAPTHTATATPPSTPAPTSDAHYYIVKENDSLWKIASEQLGDSGQVAALKEANKDVLKGSDTLRISMRLRLPAKSIASVN